MQEQIEEMEMQIGEAEGVDKTGAAFHIIHTILNVINTEIADLERRIKALEESRHLDQLSPRRNLYG